MYVYINTVYQFINLHSCFFILFTFSYFHVIRHSLKSQNMPALTQLSQIYIFQSATHYFAHFANHLGRFCKL